MTESRAVSPRFSSALVITALAALTVHCGGSDVAPTDEPSIELSSTTVGFSGTAGGAASPSQAVEITNRGGGDLSELAIEISYTAGQPTGWLSGTLSQTTAPSTLTLTANSTSTPEGSYTASVAVSSEAAENSPQTVNVTFTVAPAVGGGPQIALSVTSQNFSAQQGGANPPPQTVQVGNAGGGTLNGLAASVSYTAGQPAGWLTAALSSPDAPSALTLTATTGSLPAGTYTASVAVTSPVATNNPQTVNVTLTVAPVGGGGPQIALSSTSQNLSAQQGGANPPPQTVQVTNSGGGTLNGLAASVSYTAGQPTGWLAATLTSANAPSTLTLAATTGSLTAGTYTASVAVTSIVASNSPQTVNVTLTVTSSAGGGPAIALSTTNQSFAAPQGGANPAAQTVQVTNSGGGTLNGLTATVSYTPGQPEGWLAATLTSANAPSTLTLAATTGSLTAGTYTASVAVTSPAASNSPQAVTVTFVVAPAPGGSPSITLSPSAVTFSAPVGGAEPDAQNVDVTNGGSGTLSGLAIGEITYGAGATGWLAASLSGTTAPATLTLEATTGSLAAATYTASVPITSSVTGVSAQSVEVSFVVTSTGPAEGILATSLTSSSTLYIVEPSPTGTDVLQGPIQTAGGARPVITDLALSPGGTLYGISFTTLYTIDPSSGAAVEVGSLGLTNANALAFDGDGKLFGATDVGGLFEVNVSTGLATAIGPFGGGLRSDGDIVFAPDGTLYGAALDQGTGVLVTINPANGQATRVSGAAIGSGSVWGLAYFRSDLYGLTGGAGIAPGELVRINVSTGTATRIRSLSFDAGGAAARR